MSVSRLIDAGFNTRRFITFGVDEAAAAKLLKFGWYSILVTSGDGLPKATDEYAKSHNRGSLMDVVVVGAGPAGLSAALRAAELGTRTVLVTRDEFGGMAANDGPLPVRTLAQAARWLREARRLGRYGIVCCLTSFAALKSRNFPRLGHLKTGLALMQRHEIGLLLH
jgi:hypothetical protein